MEKAYEQMDDLGGFPIFLETPTYKWDIPWSEITNLRRPRIRVW